MTLERQTRQLAAMAYGEASCADNSDEMHAIASVLVRQRDARGYRDIASFAAHVPSFSFVVSDGNSRYQKLMKASESALAADPGMRAALAAARNALAGGPDLSHGAWFWDGADIKSNYAHHFKVANGIVFTDPAHNIYGIKESRKLVVVTKTVNNKPVEVGRYDHVYESTAAYGGTIFWKNAPDYMRITHAKAYQ